MSFHCYVEKNWIDFFKVVYCTVGGAHFSLQRGKEGQDLQIENEACGAPDSNNVERSDNGEEQTKAVVVTNEMEKEEVNLENDAKKEGNDFTVANDAVSRTHCKIRYDEKFGWLISNYFDDKLTFSCV